jgi:hypothetical protein
LKMSEQADGDVARSGWQTEDGVPLDLRPVLR